MNEAMGLICANYNTDNLGILTADRPPASLPFGGRYRLIDFVLSNMVNAGMRTVGIVTPYMYRSLLDHLGAGKEWFLDRKRDGLFVLPGSIYGFKNMSTQFLVKDMIRNIDYLTRDYKEHTIVTSANQVYNMDYRALIDAHAKSGADVTLAYRGENPAHWNRGLFIELNFEKRVTKMLRVRPEAAPAETPPPALFIDCMIFKRQVLIDLIGWYRAVDHMELTDVLMENIGNIQMYGYEFTGYVGRIDSVQSYLKCSRDALLAEIHEELFFGKRPIYTKIRDGAPTRYYSGSATSNALIPNECTVRGRVENSILFPGVTVGEDAIIKDSVIMQRSVVGRGAVVENVIADKYVTIGDGAVIRGSEEHPVVLRKRSAM
ncbi:MAG: glucose-1-phosphate adenylyltransferase subunit GlgD [Clostridiales Family XIII bacterium]|jgi:glucose-1-phosphate adenylyltransferase|nr:glucose-1-phosphate adenylyltransferase subunit GlgD [Clostridiales Family XIII bacterium]